MEAPVPPTEGLCAPGAAHFHSQHFCIRQKGLRPRFLCRLHNRLTIQADTAARFLPSFPTILFQCRSGSIHEPISWWRKGVPFQPTAGGQTHRCAVRKANCTSLFSQELQHQPCFHVLFSSPPHRGRGGSNPFHLELNGLSLPPTVPPHLLTPASRPGDGWCLVSHTNKQQIGQ